MPRAERRPAFASAAERGVGALEGGGGGGANRLPFVRAGLASGVEAAAAKKERCVVGVEVANGVAGGIEVLAVERVICPKVRLRLPPPIGSAAAAASARCSCSSVPRRSEPCCDAASAESTCGRSASAW